MNPRLLRRGWRCLWALPLTCCALPLAPLALGGVGLSRKDGALLAYGPGLAWFLRGPWFRLLAGGEGFAAVTIGQVILARDQAALSDCLAHELVHVRQGERLWPLFPLAYILAGLAMVGKRRSWWAFYAENPFEREARAAEGRIGACHHRAARPMSRTCKTDGSFWVSPLTEIVTSLSPLGLLRASMQGGYKPLKA